LVQPFALGAIERIGPDGRSNRVVVQAQVRRDGSDLPVFGKIELSNLDHDFSSDPFSLPADERGNKSPPPGRRRHDDSAEGFTLATFRRILLFLYRWRFRLFYQRPADTAKTTFNEGRLIYHTALTNPSPVLTHPLALVLADLGICQITPVCFSQLLTPTFPPAFLAAVGLTAITPPADEKHQAATDRPAK
jgi:hypothetical protein